MKLPIAQCSLTDLYLITFIYYRVS
jgi:hypothetical protein